MGDPGIDPSDRIDSIRTIRGDLIANEEIFRNRFLHPFFKLTLFFDRPPAIADFPELIRGLVGRLAKAWSGEEKNQKENQKGHGSIFKRMNKDCQQKDMASP